MATPVNFRQLGSSGAAGDSRQLKPVLCIHGINTAAQWQDELKAILAPHFNPVSIRYRQYRWLGDWKLVFEPWVVLIGLLILGLASWRQWLPSAHFKTGFVVGLIVVVLTAVAVRGIRRRLALRKVWKQASRYMVNTSRAPHVIAHSFGTHLLVTMLERFSAARSDRVVLVGCVLNTDLDWRALKDRRPTAFREVRNDWTNRDPVVWLAGLIQKCVPGFGRAGFLGFDPGSTWVHNVPNPASICDQCTKKRDALLHNVDCSGLGHSDAFLGPAHASRFWLPYFWGMDSAEYGLLLDMCETAADLYELGDQHRLSVVVSELLDRQWSWAGQALGEYLRTLIRSDARHVSTELDETVLRSAILFFRSLDRGRNASESIEDGQARWLHFLSPWAAASLVVNELLSSPRGDTKAT